MSDRKIGWNFDNSFSKLPKVFSTKLNPTTVISPKKIIFNHDLSKEIDLDFSGIDDHELALIFSGNKLPTGSTSISQAYAGHQFGHFTVLGDGRAHLIGEHVTKKQKRIDVQLKGSGQTPYSRNADGRAPLGPMLREYLISEAMNILNIPTTRSLAVVLTGENVIRETELKGAILTRIASSHIRIGTFQYALILKDMNNLKTLFDYTISRHYPKIKNKENPALMLLEIVLNKQVELICNWMRVGFVHGVMNTDNMTISGETIDYGPCAFMDTYEPNAVFSSIDRHGRYAYYNQPTIAKWNLERFAESLLPLIDSDSEKAIKLATEVLEKFSIKYKLTWLNMMRNKLGLLGEHKEDENLIIELLTWMHMNKADYTNTFCYLMKKLNFKSKIYENKNFIKWEEKWKVRKKLNNNSLKNSLKIMLKSNPLVIPRNHIVEKALEESVSNYNVKRLKKLLEVLKDPEKHKDIAKFQSSPQLANEKYVTYCGT